MCRDVYRVCTHTMFSVMCLSHTCLSCVYVYVCVVCRVCRDVYRVCRDVYRVCRDVYRVCRDVYRVCRDVYRVCRDVYRVCRDVYRVQVFVVCVFAHTCRFVFMFNMCVCLSCV